MSALRLVAVTAALLLAFSQTAWAEEGFFNKLNPFSSGKPTSSAQNKPFPGFSHHASRRKPEKSLIGKTFDSVSSTTRTAWNKTTSALSPRNLWSGSSPKANSNSKTSSKKSRTKKTASTSSWMPFASTDEQPTDEVQTMSDWLSLPRPQ